MSDKVESNAGEVAELKKELRALRGGKAAEAAKKRKKKPVSETDIVRDTKKRLRRAAKRLRLVKAKTATKKKEGGEAAS